MSSSAKQQTVHLSDPAEFVAAVPHLLGFYPEESLIVTTLHGAPGATRLGFTARVDLPAEGRRAELATELVRGPIARDEPTGVLLAVVGGLLSGGGERAVPPSGEPASADGGAPAPPHSELIGFFHDALYEADLSLTQALWTPEISKGSPWYCYTDGRSGRTPDPKASPLAAALALSGTVTFPSRAELAESVAPESAETQDRWSARLNLLQDDAEPHRGAADMCSADVETVFAAIRRTAREEALTEEDLLRVLVALSDYRVRDLAMGSALSTEARAAEQLWLTLVRKAPEPEVADAAVLLAFSAYLRGDGALAGVALERVERTRPAHRLGELLRRALDTGIGPSALSVIVRDTVADAQAMIEQEEC
ncbi:DUF4192 domain-containing protein [Actinopolyspora saharensis]|uniref:DUF4192 domain-containing protein n=1 Tax=Actinopolyspora saharensis TaxID=995062 RepID=A0A1H0XXW4_9ACTN|nr:DUF4192 domain-containing protein [Actinopolyspora saharensis]SDQ07675.1 protein of unknown function [Actinopolyspora saharensis]